MNLNVLSELLVRWPSYVNLIFEKSNENGLMIRNEVMYANLVKLFTYFFT